MPRSMISAYSGLNCDQLILPGLIETFFQLLVTWWNNKYQIGNSRKLSQYLIRNFRVIGFFLVTNISLLRAMEDWYIPGCFLCGPLRILSRKAGQAFLCGKIIRRKCSISIIPLQGRGFISIFMPSVNTRGYSMFTPSECLILAELTEPGIKYANIINIDLN